MIESGRLMRAIWLQAQPIDSGYLVSGGRDRHMVAVDGIRRIRVRAWERAEIAQTSVVAYRVGGLRRELLARRRRRLERLARQVKAREERRR